MGGYASGAPGFEFGARDKAFVESDKEQKTLKRIVELRDSGASLREILPPWNRKSVGASGEVRRSKQWTKRVLDRMARAA